MIDHVRLSDDERTQAMSALGAAFSQGRLGIEEYDSRCQIIAGAQYQYEIDQVFTDLPSSLRVHPGASLQLYSAEEIERARQSSRYPKAGLMALGALASIGIGAYFSSAITGFLLIGAVFTLLYVLKVGPASWNMPSQRALNRQRLREIKDAERARHRAPRAAAGAAARVQEQRLQPCARRHASALGTVMTRGLSLHRAPILRF
ncbi:DUF1707 SHOCT-like domain-containing protein [Corynebacterium mastitidis]|uniref:DUF1707 SHOCT-like domain-containing protein n=1 Tax=Corynebacterium mastitidis TaxID=161890 RepID=UPI0003A2E851|nr:DUF1707 domain-containing protein [Corynebacterium mastitidis]